MARTKFQILVPKGYQKKMAEDIGVSYQFIGHSLNFGSETSLRQQQIREIALEKYRGKLVKITFQNQ